VVGAAPPPAWTSGTVEVTGGRLAYCRTGGQGPVVLLSHGLTDNGLCWFRLAQSLAPDFDLIMLDARGHGDSSPMPEGGHDPARDIAEAAAQLNLDRPVVMGHSVGGRATADYAGAYPDRVSMVILEDPVFLPPADPAATAKRRARFREQVEGFRAMTQAELIAMGKATSPGWHEDDFPAWAAAKARVDPEAYPAYARSWQEAVARISAPTLLIRGEAALGALVTPQIAAEAMAINPQIRTVEIPGAGHNIRRENFTAYLAAVRDVLRAPSGRL
jgi:N-formylmaleamate deformylase